MKKLTLEQLEQIPWNRKFISGPEVPDEPAIEQIHFLTNIPFMQRDIRYGQFYTWHEIVEMVGEKKTSVLDAACGRGQLCQILKFYGHDVTGIDIDNCFNAEDSIPFIQADLDNDFPFTNEKFDLIINCTALHYLKSSEHFFFESKRVLKSKGRIIFSLPNIESIASRYHFLKTGKLSEYSNAILARRNFLYPDYIFKLLEQSGFEIVKIQGVCPITNLKIRLVDNFLGKWMYQGFKSTDSWKFASSLVIEAKSRN